MCGMGCGRAHSCDMCPMTALPCFLHMIDYSQPEPPSDQRRGLCRVTHGSLLFSP